MILKRRFLFCFWFCFLICLLAVPYLSGQGKYIPMTKIPDIHVYENPRPTCVEKSFVELKKVAEVPEDLNAPAFLVKPCSIVADAEGNVFVMDLMFRKIYKYDKDLNFIKSFGGKGRGPGEFSDGLGGGAGWIRLYLGRDNLIYAGDRVGRKIICYDRDGNLVKEYRLNVKGFPMIYPVLDKKGNFLVHSRDKYIIDVFDRSGERKTSLMSNKILASALFFKLSRPASQEGVYAETWPDNSGFECLKDGRILVLTKYNGIIYFMNDGKIQKHRLWPKHLLEIFKRYFKIAMGKKGDIIEGRFPLYRKIILDKDNEKSIYLPFGIATDENRTYIYQFNLDGSLEKAFVIKETVNRAYTRIHYKRNGLFYAVGSDKDFNKTLMIYKEVTNK